MKRIDERRFDFIPQTLWKTLPQLDKNNLRKYRSSYRWYVENDKKIEELQKQLKERKEKKKSYVTKLRKLNTDLDHLRNDYHFSFSISKLSTRNYYNGTISRRGHKSKSFTLGSEKIIIERLEQYYKRKKDKLEYLKKFGWKRFLQVEFGDNNSNVRKYIMECISKDTSLNKFSFNRKILFPLPSDKKKEKPKGVSIPIMITNQMRFDLLSLGWSRDEMKHLTPKECWEIINKGVPKKPSRDRSRNQ